MTIYLGTSLIVAGLVLLGGSPKAALLIGLIAVAGGFGYRIYAGEEIRAVAADAFFVAALLPIGLWATKQWQGLVDAPQTTDSN